MTYNYITTNIITGKQYVGTHSTNKDKDKYLGSGILILKAIKKYGRKNFKVEIICTYNTKEEAIKNEEVFISKYNTLIPIGYNISPKGGHTIEESLADSTKLKISFGNKGKGKSIEHIKHISEALKGRIPWNKNKSGVYSEKSRKKMRDSNIRNGTKPPSQLGNKWSEEAKLKHVERIKETWVLRRLKTNENAVERY